MQITKVGPGRWIFRPDPNHRFVYFIGLSGDGQDIAIGPASTEIVNDILARSKSERDMLIDFIFGGCDEALEEQARARRN